ncbi:sporulation-control protein [Prauserella shujinwangii]|uniref:Sporulation-control protein n=1 Tax=Prauserella shujinwangii TaxID=1453103 RepID=A0A2T0M2D4_9PSEU|nr:sporulation protein [Prauserella shujinwangii]PRX50897.1 sporulation-control protein [Prauserella shujinwangii]
MFKKILAAVGIGGAEVETELHTTSVPPGGVVEGVIRLRGAEVEQDVQGVHVEFVTRVEHEVDDKEVNLNRGFGRTAVAGEVALAAGRTVELPFRLPVPWETPITHHRDRPLPGAAVSVRTVLDIRGAVDPTDSDPVAITALPAQQELLDAVEQLGFRLRSADVEAGHLRGTRQTLPFFQEIEFAGSPRYRRLSQLELTFVAAGDGMDVVIEADKKAGLLSSGRDITNVLRVDHDSVGRVDWAGELDRHLGSLGQGWL